jgi:cyanophycinase
MDRTFHFKPIPRYLPPEKTSRRKIYRTLFRLVAVVTVATSSGPLMPGMMPVTMPVIGRLARAAESDATTSPTETPATRTDAVQTNRLATLQRIDQEGYPGTLTLCGQAPLPKAAQDAFLETFNRSRSVVIIELDSSPRADAESVDSDATGPGFQSDAARLNAWLRDAGIEKLENLSLRSIAAADHDSSITAVADAIAQAAAVWVVVNRSSDTDPADQNLFATYGQSLNRLGTQIRAALDRGASVGLIGNVTTLAGSGVIDRAGMIDGSGSALVIADGWHLVPDAIIDASDASDANVAAKVPADKDGRDAQPEGPIARAIAIRGDRFGLELSPRSAMILRGRRMEIVGYEPKNDDTSDEAAKENANATRSEDDASKPVVSIRLGAGTKRPAIGFEVPAGSLADLTQLRRAARWRGSGIDPGEPMLGPIEVKNGSLVIVGGGGMPQPIIDRFVELAGGKSARIVVLPTAVSREEALASRPPRFLTRAGVAEVIMLPQSRTDEVMGEAFREAIAGATGIWFDGGRQWNFVDAYDNTEAVWLFQKLLERGGVIGGSSAGATIQGEYLVRGHPLGNQVMMAEGYERGFGFLPRAAIDQHFTQRGRQRDLMGVIERHRDLVGIGIDEATAIVVRGATAEVIGDHAAHFIDSGKLRDSAGDNPYVSIPSGGAIDLKSLRPIEP